MGDQPTIANVLAQIAISGSVADGTATAAKNEVVKALVDLGLREDEVTSTIDRALELGLIDRKTGEYVAIAR